MIRRGWRLRAAALVAGAASALLAAAGPYALLPFGDLARAAAADTSVAVAFVVDFGEGAAPLVGCVKVPSGTNGYQALAAFTAQEQEQAPTYNASQLLCSINGTPASGCGQSSAGGYVYWSYWRGSSGSWQYASTGAFAAIGPGDVEGWRFENPGQANPSDPPPAASPDYAAICGPVDSGTTTTSSAGPAAGAAPSSGPAAATPGGAAPSAPSAGPAASSGPAGSAPPATHGAVGTTSTSSSIPGIGGHGSGAVTRSGSGTHAASLHDVSAAAEPEGSGALAAAIGGGLVALLAGLAVWRWRKRPRMP
jgi:hypothetical protein